MAERQYTDQQRDAIASAFSQPKVTAKRVAAMAAAGELVDSAGEPLEAFTVPLSTVRDLARQARLSEARGSRLANGPRQDAIEALRQRAIKVADAELSAVEAQPDGERDLERFRRAIRCVHDAAKIPRPPEPRPRSEEHDRTSSTPGDGAGPLLRAHRATLPAKAPEPEPGAPAPDQPRESLMNRFHRETAERMERLRQSQATQEDQDVTPAAVPEPAPNGDQPCRGRQPEEDTSSWHW